MRTIIILAMTAAIAISVAIPRHRHLSGLQEENRRLEQSNARQGPTARSERPGSRGNASKESMERIREVIIKFSTGNGEAERLDEREANQLIQSMRSFSADDISNLIASLVSDSRMAGMGEEKIHQICYGNFSTLAPCAWWEYLAAHRDLPGWQDLFKFTCEGCFRENGKRALELMEQEEAVGNPAVSTTTIHTGVLRALAVSNPDKMLEKAASPEYEADPDALKGLGGALAEHLSSLGDHQQFLAALRRSQEKNPSALVATIRQNYMNAMSRQWTSWPAADAILLMDSELTPDERLFAADGIESIRSSTDQTVWEDWFLKIDPAAWSEWAKRKPNPHNLIFLHPVIRHIGELATRDSRESSRLLEKIPPGVLREQAIFTVAWSIVEREPDLAGSHAEELPTSKEKEKLFKRIAEIKR